MRQFQTPGSREVAEWRYLFTTADPEMGWYKNFGESKWLVLMVRSTRGWDAVPEPLYAYAMVLDLDGVTLPERKDLFPDKHEKVQDKLLLRALVRTGRGHVVAKQAGRTPFQVRKAVAQQVTGMGWTAPSALPNPLHHKAWEEHRTEDPVEYGAGFMLGLQKADCTDASPAFEAGWRHGWECAVGRAPHPDWFLAKRDEVENG